jgi:hypothetical protein
VKRRTLRKILEVLAEDLLKRGDIDVSECYVDGSCIVAKKGGAELEKVSVAKVRSSWRWQIATVFLSPYTRRVLRLMKSPLSEKLSKQATSRNPLNVSSAIGLMTVTNLMESSPVKRSR